MRKVIGIGETVLDIIFKGGKPIEAVPGGSSFNAVISLGRAGVNASFISEAGNDRIGEYVIQFLRDNGVNADNVSIFPESKSPLSLAFLDENNNADYIFYKDHPHDQLEFATPVNQSWRHRALRFVLRSESCGPSSGLPASWSMRRSTAPFFITTSTSVLLIRTKS